MAVSRRSAVRRTGQVLTGFGALVVLCAVLAGGPIALLAFAGNPLPDHLPTLAEVGTTLTSRDDGQLFLRALAVVGWVGWATFAFSVLVELLAAALRRPAPRLPGMGRQQRAAAALVGSVALILAASPAAASAATLAAPHPTVAAPVVAAPAVQVAAPPAQAGSVPVQAGSASASASASAQPVVYRVAKGDYLGEVAERYLDDFERYQEVARLNRLTDPDRIHPGQLLKLPEGAVDDGARRHAAGRLVDKPPARPAPAPRTPAAGPAAPGGAPGTTKPSTTKPSTTTPSTTTPGTTAPGVTAPGGGVEAIGPAPAGIPSPQAPRPKPSPHASTASPHASTASPQVPGRTGTPGSTAVEPAGPPPAMAAGASRITAEDGINRPLAISAVLAVASIVGAQIGAVLGLRRRPAPQSAGQTLPVGRHRKS
ncbi:LysM peptidoglycan-binding domain-containing protein [Micromonospora narathiwatensis]|uniref:LysM domain-containing protein n=1 Tax=Micromonospora narathiwatensis TaxID=299146 RepID=A0A1A9AC84_9ACTN|nr:LysM peptidoglycan-binding domain-containing protein [Micromonospora narathiwatensis]SBT53771.1 LysM domain-containing protein [Micromonospora narathiwatensis]